MKKVVFLIALVVATACGPSKFTMSVELASASKSGMSLGGKNISVSYVNDIEQGALLACAASSFTSSLEADYFNGEQLIEIYQIDAEQGVNSSSKESMLNLLMETGVDLAFLFDIANKNSSAKTAEMRIYAFDAMNKADTVEVFKGKMSTNYSSAQDYGTTLGEKCAESFTPTWTKTRFTFYYYGSSDWDQASQYAYAYKFKEAVDIWLNYATSKNAVKRSVAAYNIASALTILGQKELAAQWLALSDSSCELPESSNLKKLLK